MSKPVDRTNREIPPLRLLYMGQLFEHKGVDTLVDLYRQVGENVQITVAGTGAMENEIKSLSQIEYLGWVTGADKKEALDRADLLFFPSKCNETFGLSILEALRQGLPVLASDVGAVSELVTDDYNGKLFPAGDVGAAASVVKSLVEKPARLKFWGQNAAGSVRHLTSSKMIQEHLDLYKMLVSS